MSLGFASYGLAVVAGGLSTLSPCVLPLVPILVASASAAHRLGPYVLALGLALSFTAMGVLLGAAGAALGWSGELFRHAGAVLLITFGVVLLSQRVQERFAQWASRVSGSGQNAVARLPLSGLWGQGLLGLLLGLVWSPCVGPTLGATITLASQGESLHQVILMMALFGIGAGVPLVALGLLSRQLMGRLRGRLLRTGKTGKRLLGAALLVIGLVVITGWDKRFESWILDIAPAWLMDLTTAV